MRKSEVARNSQSCQSFHMIEKCEGFYQIRQDSQLKMALKRTVEDRYWKLFHADKLSYVNKDGRYIKLKKEIKQGQADFTKLSENLKLPPQEMVTVYCYEYMLMHLFSTYEAFQCLDEKITELIVKNGSYFIDFGCGPMTSGIAYKTFLNKSGVDSSRHRYLGLDIAQPMRERAAEINKEGNLFTQGNFHFCVTESYNELLSQLKEYWLLGRAPVVILNFCYFFASSSLEIKTFLDMLKEIVSACEQCDSLIIYQNVYVPEELRETSDLTKKWVETQPQLEELGFSATVNSGQAEPVIEHQHERFNGSKTQDFKTSYSILFREKKG